MASAVECTFPLKSPRFHGRLDMILTLGTHQYLVGGVASEAMGDHWDVAGRDHVLEP